MTDTATPRVSGIRIDMLIIAVIAALGLAAVAYVLSQRQQELRSSPAGLDGLQMFLTSQGVAAQVFSGGWVVDPGPIGLLVVPLHDTNPSSDLTPPITKEDLLFQQDDSDQDWDTLLGKLDRMPGLVVLPKWRRGMRLTGIAHPALLADGARVELVLRGLTGDQSMRVTRSNQIFTALPFTSLDGTTFKTDLYAAQLFTAPSCTPIIGTVQMALLASCPLRGSAKRVVVLSDPDLLNNHGLRLGENAMIARDVMRNLAGDDTIFIDYSRDDWFADPDEPIIHERTWADLMRFFQPPFRALWVGTGFLLALVLWRSFRRAGPVIHSAGAVLDKLQAIRARARLMRLTGQDGTMLDDYAAARIAATAARLVGPGQARLIGEEQAFVRFVARRSADLSLQLTAVLTRVHDLPKRVPAAVAIGQIDELERILELIAHDT
jgi:hypothetical protein